MAWRSYVAIGDSFSEGMDDPYPDGTFRGWADLVAARLALEAGPDFGYANLAIRGRMFDRVIAEQLEPALAMRPDLVSFAAGGNDVLRPKIDIPAFQAKLDRVVERLRGSGSDVILFRYADVTANMMGRRIIKPRAEALNVLVGEVAAKHGAYLIDLYADDHLRRRDMWGDDRLHLSPAGHRRVAGHVLSALGVGKSDDFLLVPPTPAPTPWLLARGADLRWARTHLAPWVRRHLAGKSSGDLITAKRPELSRIDGVV